MRILVISDIHGMYKEFSMLLNKVKYTDSDHLILLGDYIDTGPEPLKVIQLIIGLKRYNKRVKVLKGNHEWVFSKIMNTYKNDIELLTKNKKIMENDNLGITIEKLYEVYLNSPDNAREIIDIISEFPLIYEYKHYLFVHAGYIPHVDRDNQKIKTLLFSRGRFMNAPGIKGKIMVFGHTPTKWNDYNIWYRPGKDKINIDCGAVYGGKLACLDLTNKREYYIDCEGACFAVDSNVV